MSIRIGVDIGGTFTDVILYDGDRRKVATTKTPTTPPRYEEGMLRGIEQLLADQDVEPERISFLSHATTLGTNAILEGEIPKIGLITNVGLRDVLEIGDQTRPDPYNLFAEKPLTPVPRRLRKEVPGRLDSEGTEVDPLDSERVEEAVRELVEAEVESIAVCMLFSFLNDEHERQVGAIIEQIDPGIEYALSCEVNPEINEYNRTMTLALNEAVKTSIRDYFTRLESGLDEMDVTAPLNIMHSAGGVFRSDEATRHALRTVLSGPVAGAVAVQDTCEQEGYENAIGLDMGGTSADLSMVRGGELVRTTEGEINDLPIMIPMIDINTISAGGGSISWIDKGGGLRVGPQSAGADPGPICYDRGGTQPTITDANLLLGRIRPTNFLGGGMDLAVDKTRQRFRDVIAEPLDLSVEEAALSVLGVANASLARQIRKVTVEQGRNPTEFTLLAFGGAGPLQAPFVAETMDIERVVIPVNPGVFSARGLLVADIRLDESHAYRHGTIDQNALQEQLRSLEKKIRQRVQDQQFEDDDLSCQRYVDMRYRGQSYELTVPMEGTDVPESKRAFHNKHSQLYGYAMEEEPVEIVALRVHGLIPIPTIEESRFRSSGDPYRGEHSVYFEERGFVSTDVYRRSALEADTVVNGPAILEEPGSTIIVPPDWEASPTDQGNLRIRRT